MCGRQPKLGFPQEIEVAYALDNTWALRFSSSACWTNELPAGEHALQPWFNETWDINIQHLKHSAKVCGSNFRLQYLN